MNMWTDRVLARVVECIGAGTGIAEHAPQSTSPPDLVGSTRERAPAMEPAHV